MMAVIFEVQPAPGQQDAYLQAAAALRPLLEQVDGFISIERFQSLTEPSRLLSLSFWRDEEAVARWRQMEAHRHTQRLGRASIFRDYRLRVAAVVRDYGMHDREEAPPDSRHAGNWHAVGRCIRPKVHESLGDLHVSAPHSSSSGRPGDRSNSMPSSALSRCAGTSSQSLCVLIS